MDQDVNTREIGQNLIIFAILMVVMIILAGLVIDGGFSLVSRRRAQNAADAGALAGVDILCQGGTEADARAQAIDYAVNKNMAQSADVSFGSREITVTTTIPHTTFLMRIIGTNVVTTTATASAGCYVPCEAEVLPVGWNCHYPNVGGDPTVNDCGIQYGTPGNQNNPLYVIMDSCKAGGNPNDETPCTSPDFACKPDGTLECDLNGDGTNELMTGGNTSWLDLTGGGGGANELKQWLAGQNVPSVKIHTWFTGQPGVSNAVYQEAARDLINKVVFLPVFDEYCLGKPDINCPSEYHFTLPDYPWGDTIVAPIGANGTYVHVIQYAPFQITCIDSPGTKNIWDCDHPARDDALEANNLKDNGQFKTIEGYFIKDYHGSGKCEGPDVGSYTIYLNH
jgi:hypothetical protein